MGRRRNAGFLFSGARLWGPFGIRQLQSNQQQCLQVCKKKQHAFEQIFMLSPFLSKITSRLLTTSSLALQISQDRAKLKINLNEDFKCTECERLTNYILLSCSASINFNWIKRILVHPVFSLLENFSPSFCLAVCLIYVENLLKRPISWICRRQVFEGRIKQGCIGGRVSISPRRFYS